MGEDQRDEDERSESSKRPGREATRERGDDERGDDPTGRDDGGAGSASDDREVADDPEPPVGSPDPTEYDPGTRESGHPIDGNALMIAAAKASVGAGRLPELLRTVDETLRERAAEYERSYERVDADDGPAVYLVPEGHWATLGDELGLRKREADALRRAHEQHLLRVGARRRRRREFESALELREAVVVRGPDER